MIQMKWRADSENSENSALDTIIVSHKIYEKKLFFTRFTRFTDQSHPVGGPIARFLRVFHLLLAWLTGREEGQKKQGGRPITKPSP